MIEDKENREEVDKATNRCAAPIKHSMRVWVADNKVSKSAGCAREKSARVRVAHKAVDYGVAPERRFGQEAYTKKAVDLVKNKSKKV